MLDHRGNGFVVYYEDGVKKRMRWPQEWDQSLETQMRSVLVERQQAFARSQSTLYGLVNFR
jgi:hypothetical protein